MRWNRKRIYAWFFVAVAVYFAIHYFIFDRDFKFTTVFAFFAEGRQHVLHAAPIIVTFFILLIIDRCNRKKEKNKTAPVGGGMQRKTDECARPGP